MNVNQLARFKLEAKFRINAVYLPKLRKYLILFLRNILRKNLCDPKLYADCMPDRLHAGYI